MDNNIKATMEIIETTEIKEIKKTIYASAYVTVVTPRAWMLPKLQRKSLTNY